ncbi:MAG: hypothetical protein EON52_06265 [Actinomycetales bacterium]|nr:MAG: hypothetical protein EON52_06265 [Actinomycetales bacterium]
MSIRSATVSAVALLLVVAALVSPPRADAATATSTVRGAVTLGGKPVPGVTVTVYAAEDESREQFARVATRADGSFSAPFRTTKNEIASNRYWIEIDDPTHTVIAARRDFTPRYGQTVVRNAAVHSAGQVTGYVKLPTGTDFSRLRVQVEGPTDGQANRGNEDNPRLVYPSTVGTRPSGFFRVWGLPPGDYRLTLTDPTLEYQPECHDGSVPAADPEAGGYEACTITPISIAYGQKKSTTTQVLNVRSATISGRVRTVDGTAVDLSDGNAVRAVDSQGRGVYASSNSSGVFRFRGLRPGSWKISTFLDSRYEDSYYGGDGTAADAEPVEVGAGAKATGVNIYVRQASRTYATVKPVTGGAGFTVAVRKVADRSPVQGVVVVVLDGERRTVDLDSVGRGTVTITGVPKGKRSWKVAFLGTAEAGTSRVLGSVTVP